MLLPLVEWSQRQLESSTTEWFSVVQLFEPVHFCIVSLGCVSVVSVPACWPYAIAAYERARRERAGNIVLRMGRGG